MKTAKNNHGIEYVITAYNTDNDRQIEQMVGKAMCAYANAKTSRNEGMGEVYIAKCETEYEATVRCIGMFVEQPTSIICNYVIARCNEEFGI